jgi:hypothetical protein
MVLVVAVTGASGFIGSHVVKELLLAGHTVHATVRVRRTSHLHHYHNNRNHHHHHHHIPLLSTTDTTTTPRPTTTTPTTTPKDKDNAAKTAHLVALRGPGVLRLFSADLGQEGSFDVAFAQADAVIHTAASVDTTNRDAQAVVQASVAGSLNVLHSIKASKQCRRLVHTSSVLLAFCRWPLALASYLLPLASGLLPLPLPSCLSPLPLAACLSPLPLPSCILPSPLVSDSSGRSDRRHPQHRPPGRLHLHGAACHPHVKYTDSPL